MGFVQYLVNRNSLLTVNLSFEVLAIITSVYCLMSSNLEDFFHESICYQVFTYVDACKNLVFATSLMHYSLRLRKRLDMMMGDITLESENIHSRCAVELYNLQLIHLQRSQLKLFRVMVLCLFSFTLRFGMLILKAVFVENNQENPTASWLPPYGILWWTLSDFIPR